MKFQIAYFKRICFLLLTGLLLCMTGPTKAHEDHEGHDAAESETINIAMTAAFVSEKGVVIYQEIGDYIEKKTGLDVEFVSGLSYSTINAMIESGAAQVAFVCGYPYVLSHDGKEKPPTKLLAAPVSAASNYNGQPKYYSYVIVHKDSPVAKFEELKGKTWVFNDEISNSGYNMPRAKLVSIGETGGFFGQILKSGSHEESIRMVGASKADASAVDSLVLDYALAEKEPYASEVKIIETLGPAGAPPIVYSTKLPEEKAQKIKQALLDMKNDPEGKAILSKAYLLEFTDVTEENYDDIRGMAKSAQEANFMEIK